MVALTDTELFLLYSILISITAIFLLFEILLFLIYLKRKKWNLQMVTNVILSVINFIHCIITSIPTFNYNFYCRISSAIHEGTLLSSLSFLNYIIFYAILSFEKPKYIKKCRYFFVHFLIISILLLFLVLTIIFFIWGDTKLNDNLSSYE